jgi:lauroyl/myristoyl acyltransferase
MTWRTPTRAELEWLLGPLDPAAARRIRREITCQEFRNVALRRIMMRRGIRALEPLIASFQVEPLLRRYERGEPTILVGWHLGPNWIALAAVRRLGLPVLASADRRELPPDATSGLARSRRAQRDGSAVAFLKEALAELEGGGIVMLQIDVRRGPLAPFLGRRAAVARGAAWLARQTGARLVPHTARFVGPWQVAWMCHEPRPEPDVPRDPAAPFEAAVLTDAVAFFENWVRAHPELLRVPTLRRIRPAGSPGGPPAADP